MSQEEMGILVQKAPNMTSGYAKFPQVEHL